MALSPSTRLGPYQIDAPLGAGGMGEVYLATDTRLHRRVAIKVIAPQVGADSTFQQRFEREARAISALSHPHICALFDVGTEGVGPSEVHFLVLEYLEGETLARRLERGPLPLDQVLRCALEITSALDKAHSQGIVHRDLKPANVMLTKAGAKLLDFGLAKLRAGSGPQGELLTVPAAVTAEGAILGTLQYMAPEQLEGREADARADIFALGSVIYEMATGRRAFQGKSQASLIASILASEPPPMTELQPLTPAGLDRVVRTCLAKDPDDRWQHARDLLTALRWTNDQAPAQERPAVGPSSTWRQPLTWGVLGLALGLAGAVPALRYFRPADTHTDALIRSTIDVPQTRGALLIGALSDDGAFFAYSAVEAGVQQLFLRPLGQAHAVPVHGTEGALRPFFSPDGRWLAFFSGQQLKKVALAGGDPVRVCDVGEVIGGGDWGSDGRIRFGSSEGLFAVAAEGGTPQITVPLGGALALLWPQLLPDGRGVLFVARGPGPQDYAVVVEPAPGGPRRTLVPGSSFARYSRTGHLLYASGGALLAAPFDLAAGLIPGPAVPLTDDLGSWFGVGDNGALVYVAQAARQRRLVWVDRGGAIQPLGFKPGHYAAPRVSPDGKRIALSVREDGVWTVRTADVAGNTLRKLTPQPAESPEWTRDSESVTFRSGVSGDLYNQKADGSGTPQQLTRTANGKWPGSWTRDGVLAFMQQDTKTLGNLWMVRPGRDPEPILQDDATQWGARVSPNDKWIAYVSDESRTFEVYVTSFPVAGERHLVSAGAGQEVVWRRDGSELYFRLGNRMIAVPVKTEGAFSFEKPRDLFNPRELPFSLGNPGLPDFDVSPDGRFLMLKDEGEEPRRFNVILNWTTK